MKRYLSALLVAVLLVVALAPATSLAATKYATVVGGWLRLRSSASFNASTITSYYTGTQVEILSTSGNWYRVKAPDGNTGYMYGDYLSVGGYIPTPSGETNATVISSNGYGVRMRSGPGTSYRVLAKYAVGTRVHVLESGYSWSRISVGGRTGYMMSEFLRKDGYVPPVYDGDATVWSANGYGVRLRSGPGTGYSKLGVYSVGTRVKVLERGAVWSYIQIGSRTGYMMNEFLIFNNNYKVTEVTLNNYNPVVGNILSVKSTVPSYATVNYSWRVNGIERSTSPTYTVESGDVGYKIQLLVTGIGAYSGEAYSASTAEVVDYGTVTSVTLNNMKPQVGNVLRVDAIVPANATVTYQWKRVRDNYVLGTGSTYSVSSNDKGEQIYLAVTGTGTYNGGATSAITAAVTDGTSPVIETTSLPAATKGAAYNERLIATGGGSAFTWSVIRGTLPAGLSLNASTGRITGTVSTTASSQEFKVRVSNGIAPYAELDIQIDVQDQTAQPTFSPNGGTFTTAQTVTLSAASDATIRYTTDGTEPTDTNGSDYTTPLTVDKTTTIKAFAKKSGETPSAVATRVFTINTNAQTVETPTFSVAAGEVASGTSVTLACTTEGAKIRYTLDTTDPTASTGTEYTGAITITAATTIKAIAVKDGMTSSTVAKAEYTISGTPAPAPASALTVAKADLGTVSINGTASKNIEITNTSDAEITIENVTVDAKPSTAVYFDISGGNTKVPKNGTNNAYVITAKQSTVTTVGTYENTIVVTDSNNNKFEGTVKLVVTDKTNIISITSVTSNPKVTEGAISGSLAVTASETSGGDTRTYQWYSCDASGKNEKEITGANSANYTLDTGLKADTTYYYFCRVSATDADSVDSRIITVTVQPAAAYKLEITAVPTFDAVTVGYTQPDAKAMTIKNTGNRDVTLDRIVSNDPNFTVNENGSGIIAAGAEDTTWTIRPNANLAIGTYTTKITVTYKDENNQILSVTSGDISFTVNEAGAANLALLNEDDWNNGNDGNNTNTLSAQMPVITASVEATNVPIKAGQTAELRVNVSLDPQGGSLSYEWFTYDANGYGISLVGTNVTADQSVLVLNGLTQGSYKYYCVVSSDGAQSVPTTDVSVTVEAAPSTPSGDVTDNADGSGGSIDNNGSGSDGNGGSDGGGDSGDGGSGDDGSGSDGNGNSETV